MDKKQIYDLDNRNVASQNVKLGTLLNSIESETEKPLNELTKKQVYDLTNDTVVTQGVQLGNIVDALAKGDTTEIEDLTKKQIKELNDIDVACQGVKLGEKLYVLIQKGKVVEGKPGLYSGGKLVKSWE